MTIEETIQYEAKEIIESAMKKIDSEESYKDMDGNTLKSVFIGTCFNIMPSGKYYMPFACSNVEKCSKCDGKGKITNPNADMALYEENLKKEQFWIEYLRNNSVTYYQLSETNKKTLDSIRECLKYYDETVECPVCHGVGSEEVYLDQVMQEALEDYANKYGAFVHSGEGDPCDMF
ncbi:MAG: hypothetical protein PHG64_15030, partial [Paludibacter sp.]|nr:hypothetical protein [Paludibacter sp.]